MRVAIAAVGFVLSSAALGVACRPDATPAIESDAGVQGVGGSGDSGSGNVRQEVDSGARAPTGCPLTSTSFVSGAKAENVARTDVANIANWTDVDGALAVDGKLARVTLADGQESAVLRVSDFRLDVPANAETWGIEVELKRQAPGGGIEDGKIEIEIEGKPSRFSFIEGPWPKSIVGTHEYGQEIDTWDVDLFPSDVNRPSFAATLTVKRSPGATGPFTAVVESIRVAVYYCK